MSKYFARKTACQHGQMHGSAREAKRCGELHLLQKSGAIWDLRVEPQFWFVIGGQQVKHPNGRRVGYKPDFGYVENSLDVVEDIKSDATMTEAAVLRIALFRHLFPGIELRVMK